MEGNNFVKRLIDLLKKEVFFIVLKMNRIPSALLNNIYICIYIGYLPNSPYIPTFEVLLFTPNMHLLSLICNFSKRLVVLHILLSIGKLVRTCFQ